MSRALRYLSALAVTLLGLPILAGMAQAKTGDPIGGPTVREPPIPASVGTSVWQVIVIAVSISLLTLAAALMVQWVRTHAHRGVPHAA
jgi:hypothetical protein